MEPEKVSKWIIELEQVRTDYAKELQRLPVSERFGKLKADSEEARKELGTNLRPAEKIRSR